MTAVAAKDVDRALTSRRAGIGLLLVYGPDAGLVSERARHAAEEAVDDRTDPFQLIRIDGDAIADHPGRLVEEASTFGLFGGRRAIWVRLTSRNLAPAVEACLAVDLVDTLVVVEAGNLTKTSPLRAVCERSPRALALPCYADETRDLGGVITETLAGYGLAIDRDGLDLLTDSLGGDRLATRGELAKLALYANGATAVTAADVEAIVSDVSGGSIDAVFSAAFGGDRPGLDAALESAALNGTAPAALLAMGIRHALALLAGIDRMAAGQSVDVALRNFRGLNALRRQAVTRQLNRWRDEDLKTVVEILQQASLESRRSTGLAGAVTAQAFHRIAGRARSGRGTAQPAA